MPQLQMREGTATVFPGVEKSHFVPSAAMPDLHLDCQDYVQHRGWLIQRRRDEWAPKQFAEYDVQPVRKGCGLCVSEGEWTEDQGWRQAKQAYFEADGRDDGSATQSVKKLADA